MKFLPAQLAVVFQHHSTRRNLGLLWRFMAFLAAMITVYSIPPNRVVELGTRIEL